MNPVTLRRMESHYEQLEGITNIKVKQSVVKDEELIEIDKS
jgi:hypothetical protein